MILGPLWRMLSCGDGFSSAGFSESKLSLADCRVHIETGRKLAIDYERDFKSKKRRSGGIPTFSYTPYTQDLSDLS